MLCLLALHTQYTCTLQKKIKERTENMQIIHKGNSFISFDRGRVLAGKYLAVGDLKRRKIFKELNNFLMKNLKGFFKPKRPN